MDYAVRTISADSTNSGLRMIQSCSDIPQPYRVTTTARPSGASDPRNLLHHELNNSTMSQQVKEEQQTGLQPKATVGALTGEDMDFAGYYDDDVS